MILAAFPAIFSRRKKMTESTEPRGRTLLPSDMGAREARARRTWQKVKLAFAHSVFWAYERGTWQYDLMVLVILAFIFLSPRTWFEDRPTLQLTDLRHRQGIVEVARAKDSWTYLVDARLVEAQAPRETNEALREILRLRLQRPFTITSVAKIERKGVVLGYTVVITLP